MITKPRTSLHQDNSAPLDLVDSDPHRRSATRTLNRGLAGNGEAQVRLVPGIQSLLKCDELPAVRTRTANRQVPFSAVTEITGDGRSARRARHAVRIARLQPRRVILPASSFESRQAAIALGHRPRASIPRKRYRRYTPDHDCSHLLKVMQGSNKNNCRTKRFVLCYFCSRLEKGGLHGRLSDYRD